MDLEQKWHLAQLAFQRKIRTTARNSAYVSSEHSVEDMEQELLVVLWECCSMYDPDRGASFNSFFWLRAKQRIGQIATRAGRKRRTAILVDLDDDSVAHEVDRLLTAPSAEEISLAQMHVREIGEGQILGIASHWAEQRKRYGTA